MNIPEIRCDSRGHGYYNAPETWTGAEPEPLATSTQEAFSRSSEDPAMVFSTRLAPSNRTSPLKTVLSRPSKSSTVAVVALVNEETPVKVPSVVDFRGRLTNVPTEDLTGLKTVDRIGLKTVASARVAEVTRNSS